MQQPSPTKGYECICICLTGRAIDACMSGQFLPPVMVHPSAAEVRELLLFDWDTDTVVASGTFKGWIWDCPRTLIAQPKSVEMDWCIEQRSFRAVYGSAVELFTEHSPDLLDLDIMVNRIASHHVYASQAEPTDQETAEAAIRAMTSLYSHELFKESKKKMYGDNVMTMYFSSLGTPGVQYTPDGAVLLSGEPYFYVAGKGLQGPAPGVKEG